jgi:hypothetical protein
MQLGLRIADKITTVVEGKNRIKVAAAVENFNIYFCGTLFVLTGKRRNSFGFNKNS